MPRTAHQDRHARTVLPARLALDHLKADLGLTMSEMLVEGAVLLARYHGRGQGLPEPATPIDGDAPTT